MGDTKRTREEKGSGKEEQQLEETIEQELQSEEEPDTLEAFEEEDEELELDTE